MTDTNDSSKPTTVTVEKIPTHKLFIDRTNEKHGRLLVQSYGGSRACGNRLWNCLCDCGRIATVLGKDLASGNTKSCGCIKAKSRYGDTIVTKPNNNKFVDAEGQRYGRLTVGKYLGSIGRGSVWLCYCDCGETKEVKASNLLSGKSQSCGCLVKASNVENGKKRRKHIAQYNGAPTDKSTANNFIDIEGHRYGRLLAKRYMGQLNANSMWMCECDCGAYIDVRLSGLRSGRTKSCGCILKTHGMTDTPTHNSYRRMMARCYDPKNKKYEIYGGKGITVCDRWKDGFDSFYEDMGDRPKRMTIDRKDGNGNYCPENCRWATYETQNRNKSDTKLNIEKVKRIRMMADLGDSLRYIHSVVAPDASMGTVRAAMVGQTWKDI